MRPKAPQRARFLRQLNRTFTLPLLLLSPSIAYVYRRFQCYSVADSD